MIAIARLADKGPLIAGALAAGLFLGALWIPDLIVSSGAVGLIFFASLLALACLVFSAAVVAFVALRHAEVSALQVVGGCLLLLVIVSMALYGSALHIPIVVVICWLPAIIAAMVLARSVRLDYAVLAVLFCGMLSVLILTVVMGDPTAFWRLQFDAMGAVGGAAAMPGVGGSDALNVGSEVITEQQREEFITAMANMMTGAVGISVMNIALGALFLARSWQAALVNPGGFQKEFHALSLGRNVAFGLLLVVFVSFAVGGQLSRALASIVIFTLCLQGLAVVHALVKQRGMHRFWLHGMYILLVLPHTLLLLAALGLSDNIYSLRRTEKM